MAKLLIEIFSEEIPYLLQKQLTIDIKPLFLQILANYEVKITANQITIDATANRVAILIVGLPNKIPDKILKIKGPNLKANELALKGFCQQHDIKKEDCIIVETNKGSFYFYQQAKKGGDLFKYLPNIIAEVLSNVSFKKSMAWNSSKVKWGRPIRALLGLFEEEGDAPKVVAFKYAGLIADNKIFTHKVMGKQNVTINSIAEYYQVLADNFVILNAEERVQFIIVELNKIIKQYNFLATINLQLINEIAYLVEYPVILEAKIADIYMQLPKELLVNIIVKKQRYITFYQQDDSLATKIVIVANLKTPDNGKTIIAGNEKVLNARLEDGLFFYNNDLKTSLLQKAEKLKNLSFFENLGSIFDKTLRVEKLFKEIFQEEQSRLCRLYKADLVSESVIEIPELQGIMGSYFALDEGISPEIAQAIVDHYKPVSQNGYLPKSLLGAKLAVLDKLDTLISLFKAKHIPTGSKDPYALRRATLGIIKIIIAFKLNINLTKFIAINLQEFIQDRLSSYLKSLSFNANIVSKQIAKGQGELDIYKIYLNISLIDGLLKTEQGIIFLQMIKRLENIILSQKNHQIVVINTDLLLEEIEHKLYHEILQLEKFMNNDKETSMKDTLIHQSIKIVPCLDNFLNQVVINQSPNVEIKNNRVSLLQKLLQVLQAII